LLLFQVDLSAASGQAVTVNYSVSDGTATTANNDYVATSGTVSFNPGLTSNTLAITVIGDTVKESNENLVLTLSNAVGAVITKGTATGTIVDDDEVSSIVYTGTSGNDTLRGNSAAPPTPVLDELFQGLGGNDSLFGYYGKNTFDGGSGADSLYGLTDQDTFLFPLLSDSTLGSMDTITRFSSTEGDRLKVGATPALPLNLFNLGTLTATSLTNAASLAYSAADGNTGLAVDEAVVFKYGSNYYLSVNNSANAAFSSTDDLLLKFGTLVGTPAIGTLTVSDYFAV
jgi:Ca2+-binding RTX toxin-like protein